MMKTGGEIIDRDLDLELEPKVKDNVEKAKVIQKIRIIQDQEVRLESNIFLSNNQIFSS